MGSVEEAWCEGGSCISSSARQVSRMSTEGEAAPAAEAPAEGEPLPEEGSSLPPACMDLTDFLLKVDDFEKMDALDEKAERLENCPNYRQVSGLPESFGESVDSGWRGRQQDDLVQHAQGAACLRQRKAVCPEIPGRPPP